jgi:hypothetical protein
MKKIYLTPDMIVVDLRNETIMITTSPGNIQTGTDGGYIDAKDITNTAGSGDVLDAAGYRSNLWGD